MAADTFKLAKISSSLLSMGVSKVASPSRLSRGGTDGGGGGARCGANGWNGGVGEMWGAGRGVGRRWGRVEAVEWGRVGAEGWERMGKVGADGEGEEGGGKGGSLGGGVAVVCVSSAVVSSSLVSEIISGTLA